ncbi:MAG: hypothetical protein AB7D00_12815 [Rhodospirillaceae bacterium]
MTGAATPAQLRAALESLVLVAAPFTGCRHNLRYARTRLRTELRHARALLDGQAPEADGLRQMADAADAETRAQPRFRADLDG